MAQLARNSQVCMYHKGHVRISTRNLGPRPETVYVWDHVLKQCIYTLQGGGRWKRGWRSSRRRWRTSALSRYDHIARNLERTQKGVHALQRPSCNADLRRSDASKTCRFYRKRVSNLKKSGNKVFCTDALLLLKKVVRCSQLDCQEVFELKIFSYKIVG